MRVLFVAPRFHTNQFQVVKTLFENNHEVYFHVAFHGPTEDHSLLTPVNYKQSKISRMLEKAFGNGGVKRPYYFPGVVSYWKEFIKLRPEVVIIRDPYKYFSLIAAFCAFFSKTSIIFYTQEELYRPRTKFTLLKQTLTTRFFKAAWMTPIMGSPDGKTKKPECMSYVPLPIPLKLMKRPEESVRTDVPGILMIGKYHQDRKKHMLFIEAVNLLKKKYPFKVTIVGECVTNAQVEKYKLIEEAVENLNLSDIITLRKNVPFHQMEELYTSHHIFVLPAVNEQYGVSVTEALAYGLPVICTDTCGARFNVINGENGFIVKSSSLEELTDALEKLISDKERISRMSQKAIDYVQENLSGKAFYTSFSKMISERFLPVGRN